MAARTLHVRCTTWDQVDLFLTRKLRKGRFLSMKVPFAAKASSPVTLGLELPNELVIAIEGVVQKASAVEGEASKTWIEIELVGLTEDVLARIQSLANGEGEEPDSISIEHGEEEPEPEPAPAAPLRRSQVMTAVGEELPNDERELFLQLSAELRRLRSAAVHEVLGVARDAEPEQVRTAWKAMIRRQHPDLVARRNAPAITHLAEELTILANRAYDRLRSALVAEGRGSAVGPTLAAPPGWLVGFEDIQSERTPAPKATKTPIGPKAPPAEPPSGSEAFEQRARHMLGQGDASTAREVLAAALVVHPRSKPLRSLYYVATALGALQDGEIMLAQSQLETALAHHEQCTEAAQMLDHIKKFGGKNAEAVQRLFT
jgi:hypothetical protein